MANENAHGLWIVAIIGIVAIAGLIMMFSNQGQAVVYTQAPAAAPQVEYAAPTANANMAGEAYTLPPLDGISTAAREIFCEEQYRKYNDCANSHVRDGNFAECLSYARYYGQACAGVDYSRD